MINKDQDVLAVKEVILEYAKRCYAEDFQGAWELRAKSAISVTPDKKVPLDQKNSLKMYMDFIKDRKISPIKPPTIHEIIVSDNIAFVRFTYYTKAASRQNNCEDLAFFSRHFYILQRQEDFSWKITHDTWSNISYDE